MVDVVHLSRKAITGRQTPDKRAYVRDSEARGLMLVEWPNGTRTFELYRKVDGRPRRFALGVFDPAMPETRDLPRGTDPLALVGNRPLLNVRQGRRIADALNASLDRGVDAVEHAKAARRAKAAELTLRGAFDLYHSRHLVRNGKRTAEALREDFARYLGEVAPGQRKTHGREKRKSEGAVNWESRRLSTVTKADVSRLMDNLRAGIGDRTANKVLVLLRALYRWAIENGHYIGPNPCVSIKKLPERSRARFLRSDELPRFFEALGRCKSVDFRDFVLLSLLTGARRANVLGMRWSDLDLDQGLWTVPGEKSKNGETLVIPLVRNAAEILRTRRAATQGTSTYVFAANSASGYMTPPKKQWASFIADAGLTDLRLHDLRRSLGSWQAMTGASLAVIGQSLGHRSVDATLVYARLQADPVRDAMERAASAMQGRATPQTDIDISDSKRHARS